MRQAVTDTMDPMWVRACLIGLATLFLAVLLFVPLAGVFLFAFSAGADVFLRAVSNAETLHAAWLTFLAVAVCIPLNVCFGVAAAWAITRFEFRGKALLVTLIEVPLAVSPVVAGLMVMLVYGHQGLLGPILAEYDVKVVFSLPSILIATTFVTFPLIARELIPLMRLQGGHEEAAALTLGASPWRMFFMVTLPKIRWGLLYGIILCAARAMGEFGAVSVVSGHIRGRTNTLPLHVEILYNEYQFAAAFAVASLLALSALVWLTLKSVLELRTQ
ncbi:MAG: sulfate ABC transporter permease subunit CysW [Bdellovibrionota bacterium]|nr:MAG: sulfate ABC transporter permease subunit CysW [Bdellovibrionota bacterium]